MKESIVTFVSRAMFLLSNVLTVILLSRLLGPEGQGLYTLLRSFLGILTLVFCFGLQFAFIYFIGKGKYDATQAVGMSVFNSAVSGAAGIAVGFAVFLLFPRVLQGVTPILFWAAMASFPFYLLMTYLTNVFLGIKEIGRYNFYYAAYGFLIILFMFAALMIRREILSAVIGFLAATALVGTILVLDYFARKKAAFPPVFRWVNLWQTVKFGMKGQIGNLIAFLNYRLGIFLINFFLGPAQVGFYAVALGIAESVWQISGAIAIPLYSKVANLVDKKEAARLAAKGCRTGLALSLLLSLILLAVAPSAIRILLGDKFVPAVLPFFILLPGILVFSMGNILSSYITGSGHPFYNTVAAIFSFVVNIGGNLVLIPRMGLAGAALVTGVSYMVGTAVMVFFVLKLSKLPLRDFVLVTAEDVRFLWLRISSRLGKRPAA